MLYHVLCVFQLYSIFVCVFYFFFFKQKTAYEMRISDWSSDVCSSDLADEIARIRFDLCVTSVLLDAGAGPDWSFSEAGKSIGRSEGLAEIGRASCRERVCQYV